MSRRRRSASAFSLFSFQDIVTSVTAILILLVLILSLELLARRQEAAAASPALCRESLKASIATLQALVGQLAAVVSADEIRPLVRRTHSELERDVRIVESQAKHAAADAEVSRTIESRARALAADAMARLEQVREIREDVDRMKEEATRTEEEASKLALQNESEATRLARKQEEFVKQPSSGPDLVFNPAVNPGMQAWIIEVSSEGLTVVELGTNERRPLGAALGHGSAAAMWLSGLATDRDHALILVRPSGIDKFVDIRERLKEAGIPYGVDFIGEGQVVRDGLGESKASNR